MITTAKELRFNTSMLFDMLSKGEDIIITYRGKPRAKLVPIKNDKEKENSLFGMWKDRTTDVNEEIRNLRKGRSFDL